jgi:putative hydrolase of the HAD superfamily
MPLRQAETWIFDLDNTLYPASCNLFAQVDSTSASSSPGC